MEFVTYALGPALSRAFSDSAAAAAAMVADVDCGLARVGDPGPPGFIGKGGGARSGSELSHLANRRFVSGISRV